MNKIVIKDLSIKIADDKNLLKDINIEFNAGEITAITGHNGSGKSTLTKVIMGILNASKGSVIYNKKNINKLSICERSKFFSYAFQTPIKFKGITVKDLFEAINIVDFNKMCESLSKVGLCARDYIDRTFDNSLSGGELKRIELAISISRPADFYIFDEPEAGIDLWSFDNLISIFNELKNLGAGVIVVSHQNKILENSDKIVVLNSGKIEKFGKSNDVLKTISNAKCKKLSEANNG